MPVEKKTEETVEKAEFEVGEEKAVQKGFRHFP